MTIGTQADRDRIIDAAAGDAALPGYGVRRFGVVNWLGVWTLCKKEVMRFFKVWSQTILAPVATSVLFLVVFMLALGRFREAIEGVPFVLFLAPGLIMMQVIQNAFANTSSSILISKVQGNIVDILMPPLSPGELTFSFAIGGIMRGLVVGLFAVMVMSLIAPISIIHPWAILFYASVSSLVMALLGLLAGIWAEKFDHLATVTNFIIMPLAFLSGTFYSVNQLPEPWITISHWNPVFYMIDGFRYGFTGHADGSLAIGAVLITVLAAILWVVTHHAIARGWRLKA